jgi:hypothetical protein
MIASLEQFKKYLWITWNAEDDILQILIDASNQMIITYIWRNIEAEDYIEKFNWNNQREYLVKNYPINTVDYIKLNNEVINQKDYVIESNIWRIFLNSILIRWFQNYEIKYNWWYEIIPADLVLASLKLASKYYNTKTSDWVSGETVNGDRIDFDISEIPNDILIILNNYKNYGF